MKKISDTPNFEYLKRFSKEDPEHYISDDQLQEAPIIGRYPKANTLRSTPNSRLKFSFSPDIYDERTSSLKLPNIEIKIPSGTNQDYLCRVIFLKYKDMLKNLDYSEKKEALLGIKTWSWDEIVEFSSERIHPRSEVPDKERWRTVYNAAGSINDLIEKKLQMKDFFIRRPIKTLKINPLYLQ